jgi:hypothetical protein
VVDVVVRNVMVDVGASSVGIDPVGLGCCVGSAVVDLIRPTDGLAPLTDDGAVGGTVPRDEYVAIVVVIVF